MNRLEKFVDSLVNGLKEEALEPTYHATAVACEVLERRIRELARAIDADVQGPAQSYLDEEAQ